MDYFITRYPDLITHAINCANAEIKKQTAVRDAATKKVQELRAIDTTSTYTSIGSNAGQAEIGLNIAEATLKADIEHLELIIQWAEPYLEYIKSHEDIYDFNASTNFSDLYKSVNTNHVNQLIRGHKFECKCQFFGHGNGNKKEHFYTNGNKYCDMDVPVYLENVKVVVNTIGAIQHTNPDKLGFYAVPI